MKKLFDFELKDDSSLVFPKDIVQYQCDELSEMTNGLVIGKIKEYNGPIKNYTTGLPKISRNLTSVFEEKEVNIQSDLGELSGNKFTYEFYITSKYTTNFIYRVFFLQHGISIYPLHIVLDENIAFEIEKSSAFNCKDEDEFYYELKNILNSEKIKTVISNLYIINKNEEESETCLIANNDAEPNADDDDEI